nr:ATP-binding protein [Micropruina sp.]
MAERGALPDSTQLLERDREFDQLASALRSARDRHGMVALVSGEAGIGKTTLVRRFLRTLPGDIRALAGSCEDLIAARVLGPFRE